MIKSSKDHHWMLKSLDERFLENRVFAFHGAKLVPPPTSKLLAKAKGKIESTRSAVEVTTLTGNPVYVLMVKWLDMMCPHDVISSGHTASIQVFLPRMLTLVKLNHIGNLI